MSRIAIFAISLLALTVGGASIGSLESASRAGRPPERVQVAFDADRPVAELDPRFLSFAIDTAQVVGGEFWAPRGQGKGILKTHGVGRYDFDRPRLRRLAGALAPAYLRIGGTDADRTVYHLGDGAAPAPPPGARWVLTRERWDQVNDFARDLDLRVMFTLNAGPSARDGDDRWDPSNARALMAYSRQRGYRVDVWELGNEVNVFPLSHRSWLSAAQYGADLRRARALVDELAPAAKLAGPSSAFWPIVGEGRSFSAPLLREAGPLLDVVSWHYYPQQSHRCPLATRRATPGRLLPPAALADVERWAARIEALTRDHAPRAQVWLGETGGAQCGGEPGLTDSYADALWWLDELGRMARRGQAVVVRQTLSGSDYGLLDDTTLEPNPSYWASWLWRRLMGNRALAVEEAPQAPGLRAYAHCTPADAPGAAPGAVTLLLANLEGATPIEVDLGPAAAAGTSTMRVDAAALGARTVRLNGVTLAASADGTPPALAPLVEARAGVAQVSLAPLSITFVVLPHANAAACLR